MQNEQTRSVSRGKVIGTIVIGILLLFAVCFMKIFENVSNEKIVVNQVPISGTMEYWTTPGLKFQKWGDVTEYDKTQQLWFSDQEGEGGERATDLAIPVIFNDAGNGRISGSLRVKLPTSETHLSRIHTDYHGMDRLMNDLVRPTVVKVVYASGPLMSSFESYAEKKNDLIHYITDQLNYGVYKTTIKEEVVTDALTGEEKKVKVASLVPDSAAMGGYARQENSPFAYYGLEIGQLSISKIDYDARILEQIKTQQEANMAVQTAKAQALEAQQQTIRAEEEGKAAAMKAKWKQEEVNAVEIAEAEKAYKVAEFQKLQSKEIAEKEKALGEAKAYANRALVSAGLTPLEKANIEKETKIGVAEALSKLKLPTYVVSGGGSGQANAMDAMGLKMMTEMVDKLSK